jgi:hypothetical protein
MSRGPVVGRILVGAAALGALAGCGRLKPADVCESSTAHTEVATINETASTNSSAIDVAVFCDGSATRTLEPRGAVGNASSLDPAPKTFPPGSAEVLQFLADLDAVGSVSAIHASPASAVLALSGCPKSVSFGTETTISAGGKTSGDIQCLQNPSPADTAIAADSQTLLQK